MKRIFVYRYINDYHEVVEWCREHFAGTDNGRYEVYKGDDHNRVCVHLIPYTEEAATLITLKWLR